MRTSLFRPLSRAGHHRLSAVCLILIKLSVEERFDGFARGDFVGAVDLDANLGAARGGETGQAEDAFTVGEFLAVINADIAGKLCGDLDELSRGAEMESDAIADLSRELDHSLPRASVE